MPSSSSGEDGGSSPSLSSRSVAVPRLPKPERKTTRKDDASWAALMKHSFGLDVLGCPKCQGRLTLVAVIFDHAEVKRFLQHLRLFSEPIPVRRARDPPELWTEAYDF